jgi:hypothetical protein
MATTPSSPAARFLLWLADAVYFHRRWFFYPQAALVLLCVLYTVRNLEFHTSRNDLVGGEKEYHRIYLEFKKEFPVQEDLVVVVESENLERNRQFVERLGRKLERETNLFASVFYKGDLKGMGRKALLFLPEKELAGLQQTFEEYKPVVQQFTRATNLVALFDLVNTQFRTAQQQATEANQALVKALPALVRIVSQAADSLARLGNPPSPGVSSLFENAEESERQMYITYGNGRIFLITTQAKREELNARAVGRLRELIAETQLEVPGLNVGVTGEPVLEVDEMEQSQKDTTIASVVSFVLVALIFIYGYNETGRPLKATACLLAGIAYTMGYTTLVVGHLNILTITFVPILVGLAIDFGVHLITRYEEELRHGRTEKEALEKAMVFTGMGIFTGCFTTAGAFFAMAGTDFDGIQEMGVICGGGLLVCLVPMMTLLPVLLLRGEQNILDHELGPALTLKEAAKVDTRARIENFWLRRPVLVIVVVTAISLLCLNSARRVKFDYNLLHMQSEGLPAVIFQDKLIESSKRSVLFGAVVATNLDEAVALTARLKALPTVESVESMVDYLTEDQTRKLERLRAIKQVVSEFHFAPVDRQPVNVPELELSIFGLHGYAGLALKATEKEEPEIHRQLLALRAAISLLTRRLLFGPREEVAEKLAEFQMALFDDVRQTFAALQQQDDSGRLTVDDLPPPLRSRFVGVNGRFLLQVYPKHDVWERKEQEEFVRDLRQVLGTVTGTPVQLLEYTTLLKTSFEEAALFSLIAICLLVFIHFRRISCVMLALLPVAVGSLWMVGVMGVCDIPFNPANIMTLPLVIGVGVTNGIHILNRFAEEQHPSILARSTGKAVLVSGLTTIAGFGSLVLAQHRGIESLGWIMATGTATCMFVGLTFLPAILNLLSKRGWTIKKNPAGQCTVPAGSGGTEVKASSMW